MLSEKQSNIYNKQIQTTDGTLINNWYEEGELRRQTGEGRTIHGSTFGKVTFDPETVHTDTNPKDNTFKRVIGTKEPQKGYFTTNSLYGTRTDELLRYTHPKLREPERNEQFKKYLSTFQTQEQEEKKGQSEFRSFDTTQGSIHVPQPFETYVGLRHMKTQDLVEIPREKAVNFIPIEKLKKMGAEAAQAEVEEKLKKKEAMQKAAANGVAEDAPLSFWMTKINTSDMYRTFIKEQNPWARSHAFTQPLQLTRGAIAFYQNAYNSKVNEGFLKAAEEEKNAMKKEEPKIEVKPLVTYHLNQACIEKIIKGVTKRGWCGLRLLKVYLRGLSGHKTELIDRNGFKYHLAQKNILLNDEDMSGIFSDFDRRKSDQLNFIEFLNSIRTCSEDRAMLIEQFLNQLKVPGKDYVSYKNLISIANMNYHPEVIKFLKTSVDCEHEYQYSWDNLKEEDVITQDGFRQFFCDVSTCVESDDDFRQLLKALGYK